MPSLPAARFSGSLCSRDLILKLLHINSSIPSKLPYEIIFWCTKLPISQFFDEFSNAEMCFLHMTVSALFPVSPPTVDGSHDILLFLMICQNFLGDLFHKASAMASALHFCCDFRQALDAYLNFFLLSFSDGVSRRVSRPVFWSLGLESLRSRLGLEGLRSRCRALRLETLHRLFFVKFWKKVFLEKTVLKNDCSKFSRSKRSVAKLSVLFARWRKQFALYPI